MKQSINAIGIAMILFLFSCSKNNDATAPQKGVILTTNATLGNILTDSAGRTLYMFAADVNGTSGCTGGCTTTWPSYYTPDSTHDSNLKASDFGTLIKADGSKQTTYKGWPLYYYSNDITAGTTLGENVGGVWFTAKSDYTIMIARNQLVGANGKSYVADYTEGTGLTVYFTDGFGRTLYTHKPDKQNTNTFTKADLSNNAVWPVFEAEIKSFPSALDKTLFGVIDVFGKKQLTFKGWPLFYYGQDAARGQNKGISVPAPGTVWPYVNNTIAPATP